MASRFFSKGIAFVNICNFVIYSKIFVIYLKLMKIRDSYMEERDVYYLQKYNIFVYKWILINPNANDILYYLYSHPYIYLSTTFITDMHM